ncbi:MAG: amidohydrolase [Flaviflexus sp.]|uniref:amidohydrolase n=1 Tax=Flaviflexus sp. TaxID=1969482 RepID=UPI003F921976
MSTECDRTLERTREDRAELYKRFHQIPELSLQESETSSLIAERLRALGLDPTAVGGTGLVAVLKNGDGPVVAFRADIDGLPVAEKSGKDYASTATTTSADGETVGLMHACGHDVHIVSLLGALEALVESKDDWSGTFVAVFQPAEETAEGARAMVEDGLAEAMPKPDVFLAQHVMSTLLVGTVGTRAGEFMAAAASIKVTVHGSGSHGSMPHAGVDPVVLASAIVLRLQTIVSREISPAESAVVTVGAIRSGSKSNVIPETATLLINTRAFDDAVEKQIHAAIERIVRAECDASGSPRPPEFEYYDRFPLTVNDEDVTDRVQDAFDHRFGDRSIVVGAMSGSEDFTILPDVLGVPSCYWVIGGFKEGKGVPNHSPFFAPEISSIDTGAEAIIAASMEWLGK